MLTFSLIYIKGFLLSVDNDSLILLIEGKRGNHSLFAKELEKKGYDVLLARSGSEGLLLLDSYIPDVTIVNAASLRTNGVRICQSLRKRLEKCPLILVVAEDLTLPDQVDANVILNLPFTVQKLINRINLFAPIDGKQIHKVGPLSLNLETHLLTCNRKKTQLTPRLTKLLKYLMDRPGQIINRETLFKDVWETDYLGDTRTLDVHISWLRKAIEVNPRKPHVIRTIRSNGYKLEI